MHSIEYTKQARKALDGMSASTRRLVESKIEGLADDPATAQNVKKLVGQPGYRLRVGDWRVIYDLDNGRLIVRVLKIGARGGVYK